MPLDGTSFGLCADLLNLPAFEARESELRHNSLTKPVDRNMHRMRMQSGPCHPVYSSVRFRAPG